MNVITAPERVVRPRKPIVFLAGSIEMGTASRWQDEVMKNLAVHTGTLLNPRRVDWDAAWEQVIENPKFKEQVMWELAGIEQSDYVAFYFDPHTKSPVTLLELGLALGLGKRIFIACPSGFWRKGNVDIVAMRNGVPVHESLAELIEVLKTLLPTQRKEIS